MRTTPKAGRDARKNRFCPGVEGFEGRQLMTGGLATIHAPMPPPALVALTKQAQVDLLVVSFAQSKLGTKVGSGQCYDLVYQVLASAHAKNADTLTKDYPPGGYNNADYVWGNLVATLTASSHPTSNIVPGDVIQFRNAYFYNVYPNGSYSYSSFPHHSAIVESVSGSVIHLLQQNVGTGPSAMTVQRGTIDLSGLKSGTMWVYAPIPNY